MPSEVGPEVHAPTLTEMVTQGNPDSPGDEPSWCMEPTTEVCRSSAPMNRIRDLRLAAGLTLDEVARRAGTSVQQLSRLERGHRRLTDAWMRRIAAALGVLPAALLPDSGPDINEFVKLSESDKAILRLWHTMGPEGQRIFRDAGRTRGLEIVTSDEDQPRRRRA